MSRCLWPIKLFGLTALIVSCASKPTGIQPSVTIPESWVRIALPHPSVFPDYSEDGQQLIFVHENIKQHLKPQIYRFDIETKQSTQLSFNSGHNIHPTFVSEKSFAFLSTTDHDKESPRFLRTDQEKDWSFPALLSAVELPYHFDVYQMDLAKKHIDRKTRSAQQHLYLSTAKDRSAFAWVEAEGKTTDFMVVRGRSKPQKVLSQKSSISWIALSPKGYEVIFVQYDNNSKSSHLYRWNSIKKTKVQLLEIPAQVIHLDWNGELVSFSANLSSVNSWSTYVYDLKKTCLRQQTPTGLNTYWPRLHPTEPKVLLQLLDSPHILTYEVPLNLESTCLPGSGEETKDAA